MSDSQSGEAALPVQEVPSVLTVQIRLAPAQGWFARRPRTDALRDDDISTPKNRLALQNVCVSYVTTAVSCVSI